MAAVFEFAFPFADVHCRCVSEDLISQNRTGTFEFRIDAHVRLFISEKKSYLCKLIRDCAFINFFPKN